MQIDCSEVGIDFKIVSCRSDKSKYVSVVWKKLAQQMRQVDSLVVAKIEADANEHPHLADEAYPCILFYAAGSSQPLKYEGEHHLKARPNLLVLTEQLPSSLSFVQHTKLSLTDFSLAIMKSALRECC